MNSTNPYNYPFIQKDNTMYLSTITKQDFSSQSPFYRESSFLQRDIPGTTPKVLIPQGSSTNFQLSTYIEPVPDRSKHINKTSNPLFIDDIEGARPKCTDFRTRRVVDPLCPKYMLPSASQVIIDNGRKFLRDTLQCQDINGKKKHSWMSSGTSAIKEPIQGSSPSKLTKDLHAVPRLEVKDINKDMIFETKRVTDPLKPSYLWRDDDDKNLNKQYGKIEGSEVKRIHPLSVSKDNNLCLGIKDIDGSQANSFFSRYHFIDKLYADPGHRQGSGFNLEERNKHNQTDKSSDAQLSISRSQGNQMTLIRLISYMQNEIYSYSFPLFQDAYNAFVGSFKSKQLLLGGAVSAEKSLLNLFNYEDENLKKSSGNTRSIEGRISQLIVGQYNEQQLPLLVVEKEGKHCLLKVNKDDFSKQDKQLYSTFHTQTDPISALALRSDHTNIYLAGSKEISIFDTQKGKISGSIAHEEAVIQHLAIDPNFDLLTYVCGQKQVRVLDKKSYSEKYLINGPGAAGIVGIDYNPNKQNCLMTCHYESIKFWDIRKGGLPFKVYNKHHNLLTQAKYNHSHDELIACGYDDGSVGLLRLVSASSSTEVDVEDALVRLYDEHEDSVLRCEWGRSSAWMFVSVSSSPTLLVLNMVPNAEKYRILL